ncbi:MAG: DUF3574 domain-containing protein [Verrucomicrobiae bacterium]|nr:DUF3574 domain-containing protein [Verrucomicrobiae bacterium]
MSALLMAGMLAGCAATTAGMRYELCFGLSRDNGKAIVSETEWNAFLQREIVPRFPDGFTVFNAKGYWRDNGKTHAEPSKILMVAAPDTPETRQKIADIASSYKERFKQEAVLEITAKTGFIFR